MLDELPRRLLLFSGERRQSADQRRQDVFTLTKERTVPKSILGKLKQGTVLGDGGYLLALYTRGYVQAGPFTPEVTIEHPNALRALHEQFCG